MSDFKQFGETFFSTGIVMSIFTAIHVWPWILGRMYHPPCCACSFLCCLYTHSKLLHQLNFSFCGWFWVCIQGQIQKLCMLLRTIQKVPSDSARSIYTISLSVCNIVFNLHTKELQEDFNLNNRDSAFIYTYSWVLIIKAVASQIDIWWTKGNCLQQKRTIVFQ